jgi:hypothetical protein
MTSGLTHKEATAHVRGRLKAAGIKARCKLVVSCGSESISVSPIGPDDRFSTEEQETICRIGIASHLTFVRGLPIDPTQGTYGHGMEFYR